MPGGPAAGRAGGGGGGASSWGGARGFRRNETFRIGPYGRSMPSTTSMDIRPFRLAVPDDDLVDLRRRLSSTRWPAPSPEPGWGRGVPLDNLRDLSAYWAGGYDWRRHEAALNELPQS